MAEAFDIAVIGAGMAGASLAAELSGRASVLLVEAEDTPGYHATGRSAAFWTESYGGPGVQPLTTASGPFLRDGGFLRQRGALTIGRDEDAPALDAFASEFSARGVEVRRVGRDVLETHIPGLRDGWTGGALEPSCSDIDVAKLHQHYLKAARNGGAELRTRAGLVSARPEGDGWHVELADGSVVLAGVLVDAAGAWADDVARRAGVKPLGITPLRRTIVQLAVTPSVPDDLPLVIDVRGQFYFKPDAGRLWLSPHDETPSAACDVAPEEIDVALAIDRLQGVVDWKTGRIEHRWAGLRSFSPDRLPVYGYDQRSPRFFWFAGQGGFGIQTAPAAAHLAARLLLGEATTGIDSAPYAPSRFP